MKPEGQRSIAQRRACASCCGFDGARAGMRAVLQDASAAAAAWLPWDACMHHVRHVPDAGIARYMPWRAFHNQRTGTSSTGPRGSTYLPTYLSTYLPTYLYLYLSNTICTPSAACIANQGCCRGGRAMRLTARSNNAHPLGTTHMPLEWCAGQAHTHRGTHVPTCLHSPHWHALALTCLANVPGQLTTYLGMYVCM